MTNGEKIIETFPNEDGVLVQGVACVYYGTMRFDTTWWNAEYKEQEPCDDAISRDMALEKMADYVASGYADSAEDFEEYSRIICQLPSVTHKSGKWIDYSDEGYVECPFCGHATNCEDNIDELHYCFYCGAKLVEPQESEG